LRERQIETSRVSVWRFFVSGVAGAPFGLGLEG
jgi:hypothetical protein